MDNETRPAGWYSAMLNSLCSRKYSVATRRRYIDVCLHISWTFNDRNLKSLNKEELEWYFATMEKAGASESTINQAISAATYLWRNVFEIEFPVKVRPQADKRLPGILSRNQIMRLIAAAPRPNARLALALAYSAGMRVSEIAMLQVNDINRDLGMIYIRSGKGRKDRVVPLSNLVAEMLDKYLAKNPTKKWIFPGAYKGHISVRALQHAIVTARTRANLTQDVSMHTLRHSYATHLVERGTDLETVKELMGHTSLDTLQQYLHLSGKSILCTKSPLDDPPLFQ